MTSDKFAVRINQLIQNAETFCLATVIGSTAEHMPPGMKLIVRENKDIEGQIEDSRLLESLVKPAQLAIRRKKCKLIEPVPGIQVFLDPIHPELKLIVCGAGHIAITLSQFARQVGFRVMIIDDRDDFANQSRFPGCDVLAADFSRALRDLKLNQSHYVVVITRGHEHDVDCLREILKTETAYVGLIGSRRRVRFVLQILADQGIARERLQVIFTPIGTPIGAESPEEIALSITAELVCVRRKGDRQARALRTAVGIDP